MKQIKLLSDLNIKEIIKVMLDGTVVYRLNLENDTVTNLNEKSIKTILRDEDNRPHMYAYFMIGESND